MGSGLQRGVTYTFCEPLLVYGMGTAGAQPGLAGQSGHQRFFSPDPALCLQDSALTPELAPPSTPHLSLLLCACSVSHSLGDIQTSFSQDAAVGFWILGTPCSFADLIVLLGPGI